MLQSHIVEIDGVFVGAAVRLAQGFRFVAVDRRLCALNGIVACSLIELTRQARRLLLAGREQPPDPGNGAPRP
jgi:hypothetical protein